MTDATPQIGFRQFPPALKFVVVWTSLLGLFYFILFIFRAFAGMSINIYYFMLAFIYFTLASGLNVGQNASRIWVSVFTGVGAVISIIVLLLMIFSDLSFGITYFSLDVDLPRQPIIILLAMNIVFNVILLYILLRPTTKALFTPPPAPIPTPQDPA